MSMDALLEAAAEQLRSVNNWTIDQVDVLPQGRPPAMMGEFFIGLDEVSVTSGDKAALKETYAIEVVITIRASQVPRDRMGEIYRDNRGQLGELERKIIPALHGQHAVRSAANEILKTDTMPVASHGDIFQFPLYFLGRGRSETKLGEWAGALQAQGEAAAFVVRKLNFGGALRVQNPAIMK